MGQQRNAAHVRASAALAAATRHSRGVMLNRARNALLKCDRSLKPRVIGDVGGI